MKKLIPLLISIVLFTSCKNIQENARKELEGKGIQFNEGYFYQAIRKDDSDLVKLYLDAGMDPNNQDSLGYTPIRIAAEYSSYRSADILIKSGAEVNIQCEAERLSPLAVSVIHGNIEMVEYLLRNKAEVNQAGGLVGADRDNSRKTPLFYAVMKFNKKMTILLLNNGADINHISEHGTVLTRTIAYAKSHDDDRKAWEFAEFLKKHGAKTSEEMKKNKKSNKKDVFNPPSSGK